MNTVAIGALLAGAGVLALAYALASGPDRAEVAPDTEHGIAIQAWSPVGEPLPSPVPDPVVEPPSTAAPADPAPAPTPTAVAVDPAMCPAWLPAATAQKFTPEQTQELAKAVGELIGDDEGRVAIDYKRGISFAQSDMGSPDDAPFDGAVNRADADHVCASQALWLFEYVRTRLARREVVCCGNVCGAPTDGFNAEMWAVLRATTLEAGPDAVAGFTLDAWVEVDATGEDEARDRKRQRQVAAAVDRLVRSSCPR